MAQITSIVTSGLSYAAGDFTINVYVDAKAYNMGVYVRSGSWFGFRSRTPTYQALASGGVYTYSCFCGANVSWARPGEIVFTYYISSSDTVGVSTSYIVEQPGYMVGVSWGFTVNSSLIPLSGGLRQWKLVGSIQFADGTSQPINYAKVIVSSVDSWLSVSQTGISLQPQYVFGTCTASAASSARSTLLQAVYEGHSVSIVIYQESAVSFDILAAQGWLQLGAATITQVDVYEYTEVSTPVAGSSTPICLSLGFYSDGVLVRSAAPVSTTFAELIAGGLILGPSGVGDGIASLVFSVQPAYSATSLVAGLGSSTGDAVAEMETNAAAGINVVSSDISVESNLRHLSSADALIQVDPVLLGERGGTLAVTYLGTDTISYTSGSSREEYVPLTVSTSSAPWLSVTASAAGAYGPTTAPASTPNSVTVSAGINTGGQRSTELQPVTAYTDGSTNAPFVVPQYLDQALADQRLLVTQAASSPDFVYSNLTCTGVYPQVTVSGGTVSLSLTVSVSRTIQGGSPEVLELMSGEYTITSIAFADSTVVDYASLDTSSGDLTWQSNPMAVTRSVSVVVEVSAFGLSASATCTCTQAASALEYTYSVPQLLFSYPTVSATGGVATPILSATQQRTGNDGSSVELSLNFVAGDFTDVVFTASSQSGVSLDSTSGNVTWEANSVAQTRSLSVSVSLMANGMQGSATAVAEQLAAEVTYTYATPIVSLSYGVQDASAGEVTPTLSATQLRTGDDGSSVELELSEADLSGLSYSITSGTGASIVAGTGVLSWTSNAGSLSSRMVSVSVVVLANGVQGSGSASAIQAADTIVSYTPWVVDLVLGNTEVDAGYQTVTYTASATRDYTFASGVVQSQSGDPDVTSNVAWVSVNSTDSTLLVQANPAISTRYAVITATYSSVSTSANLLQSGATTNINLNCVNNFTQLINFIISGTLTTPESADVTGTYNSGHSTVSSSGMTALPHVGVFLGSSSSSITAIILTSTCNLYNASGDTVQGYYGIYVVVYSSISGTRQEVARTGTSQTCQWHTAGGYREATLPLDITIPWDPTIQYEINIVLAPTL